MFLFFRFDKIIIVRLPNKHTLLDKEETTEETIPMSDFRIRSRKANLADCTCLLRPGIDVCVNTIYQPPDEESDD